MRKCIITYTEDYCNVKVVLKYVKNSEVHESNVLHKSKDCHYKTGFIKRKRIQRKLLSSFDDRYSKDRQSNDEEPSSKSGNYLQYLNSGLKWFNEGTQVYMQRQVTNLKFAKYRATQTTMTEMAKEIIGDVDVLGRKLEEKACRIVFIGNCSTPNNSIIRGHLRVPTGGKLSRYIRQLPNTIVIPTPEEIFFHIIEETDHVDSMLKSAWNPAIPSFPRYIEHFVKHLTYSL